MSDEKRLFPVTDLPYEDSPSDYGYLLCSDDKQHLKRIMRKNLFKANQSGGSILSGEGEPDANIGRSGDIYVELTPRVFEFQMKAGQFRNQAWYYGDSDQDEHLDRWTIYVGAVDSNVVYEKGTHVDDDPIHILSEPTYYSENAYVSGFKIIMPGYYDPLPAPDPEKKAWTKGCMSYMIRSDLITEGLDYDIEFDIEAHGVSDGIWIPNVTPGTGGKYRHYGIGTRFDGDLETAADVVSLSSPPSVGEFIENFNGYWGSILRCAYESGTTFHYKYTMTCAGNGHLPFVIYTLGFYHQGSHGGGEVNISNLRVIPHEHYQDIKNIWYKDDSGFWNKDKFSPMGDIDISTLYDDGDLLATLHYLRQSYDIYMPDNIEPDDVSIDQIVPSGTETFNMTIDGVRTRIYVPPASYDVGFRYLSFNTDPNGRKLYTTKIYSYGINNLKTTYSGNTNFAAKSGCRYKVVCQVSMYKASGAMNVSGTESFYAELAISNMGWEWESGSNPVCRKPARNYNGTRFNVFLELEGYITAPDNSNPYFSLIFGGKHFTNSYQIATVYYSIIMTRIE